MNGAVYMYSMYIAYGYICSYVFGHLCGERIFCLAATYMFVRILYLIPNLHHSEQIGRDHNFFLIAVRNHPPVSMRNDIKGDVL